MIDIDPDEFQSRFGMACIKSMCNGHRGKKWRGFRLGDNDALLVRIRRKASKHFFLRVENVHHIDSVEVSDPKRGIESGTAVRYNDESFRLT